MSNLDFFVVSGLLSFNNGLKETKGNFIGGDVFMMQRYLPSRDDSSLIYRSVWRKDKGYKFYKLSSIFPFNG